VDLPHDFVHQLGQPSSYFWLGPLATVVTGLLALGGAIIAFFAVKRTIRANADNVQDQIDANNKAVQDQIAANAKGVQDQIDAAAAQQQKNHDAEWARMRRKEVLDLLVEAGHMARKLASVATTYATIAENPETFNHPEDHRLKEKQVEEFADLNVREVSVRVMVDKLAMHGLTTVSTALEALEVEAGAIIQDIDPGPWTIYDKEQAVFAAIKDALQEPPSLRDDQRS
jgi:hypothetical protein